jgi:hypothetical protein
LTTIADPYKLLRTLEDVTDTHARTVRRLNRVLNKLRKDIEDEELQILALNYLRRLRVLRTRLVKALGDKVDLDNVEKEVRDNIATLSEYMIIVGTVYERELIQKAIYLARKGARLLTENIAVMKEDLASIDKLVEKLQDIVDRYY